MTPRLLSCHTELWNELREIFSALMERIHGSPTDRIFTVRCRSCGHLVVTGLTEFPFHFVRAECDHCGQAHTYRPSEVSFGVVNNLKEGSKTPSIMKEGKTTGRLLIFSTRPHYLAVAATATTSPAKRFEEFIYVASGLRSDIDHIRISHWSGLVLRAFVSSASRWSMKTSSAMRK